MNSPVLRWTQLALAGAAIFTLHFTAWAQSPPQQFTASFTNGANVVTVDFERFSVRSPNFSVVVQDSSGALVPFTPPESATYLGTPIGYSGALACATRKASGAMLARIFFEDGATWAVTGGDVSGGSATVTGNTNWPPQWPTFTIATGAGSNQYAVEVGFDSSWAHFNRSGLNAADNLAIIEHSVLCANVVYLRDAGILHRIGRVVMRGDEALDPYKGLVGGSALLAEVERQWNTVLPPSTHQIAAMLSTTAVGGGLAWVGAIGASNRYSVNDNDANGDFSVIWRHEAGHNWGSNHFEGGGNPEGATIMSGNGLSRFSSSELSRIVTHRNTKLGILENLGPFRFPLPPRASMDAVVATVGGQATIDVLANDHDGNGDAISITSFDAVSNLGGAVTRSIGTGPGGRDVLSLQMIADHGQADWFRYHITDASGGTATGIAYVQGENPSTKLTGTIIGTSGSYANNSATTKAAALDGSLATFYDAANATGDWVGLDLGADSSLAITKIKFCPRAAQPGRMNGGMFQASNVADFSSGVVTLFTISASPATGTLTSQSLTNNIAYRYVRYLGPTNGSCNVAEIEFWGAPPAAPNPPNGVVAFGARLGQIDLSWNSSALAASYKVKRAAIAGGPYTTVASALTTTTYSDTGLASGQRYYYVISAINEIGESASSAEASAVANSTPNGEWKFDDGTGSVAIDSSIARNHGSVNGATWVAGFAGTALQFNGVNSFVTLGKGPSVSGSNNFTLSAWIKTTATAKGVILQQRDAGGFNGEYQLSLNAGGSIQFMVYGGNASQFDFAATQIVRDGAWHHIVAVRDGAVGNIYIDGNPTPAATATGSAARPMDANISVAVGRDIRDNNLNFNGSIDEVRIYKTTALTGSEVQALYYSYFAPVQPQIATFSILSNGSFSVSGTGAPAQTYVLRSAANLSPPIVWLPIQTNVANAAGAFTLIDTAGANSPALFYHVTTP